MKFIVLFFIAFSSLIASAQVECPIDVAINEAPTIKMCADAPQSISGTSGFASYSWTGPSTGSGQLITPTASGQYVLEANDGTGCLSHDTINVIITQVGADVVSSSNGTTICPSTGTDLSLGNAYVGYSWNTGSTDPSITVNAGGIYSVEVTDADGCKATFDTTIDEVPFEVTQSDNTGCVGAPVTITASGGNTYNWSTGETGSSIVVAPSSTTTYSVEIAIPGCVETHTATVIVSDEEPFSLPDTIYLEYGNNELLEGPTGFASYSWTPDYAVDNPIGPTTYFIGEETTTISLEATAIGGCVITDQVVLVVVRLTIPDGFSPNKDGKNDVLYIEEASQYNIELTVFNRWGDIVYNTDHYLNDWNGECLGDFCINETTVPDGTYFYMAKVEDITFKGSLTIKQ